jgi:hypothetical protein
MGHADAAGGADVLFAGGMERRTAFSANRLQMRSALHVIQLRGLGQV